MPGPPEARTILLCAPLDTVPLAGPVQVVETDGVLSNQHEAILGADNKAAVATILATARHLAAADGPLVGLELLFTTKEETGLAGARAFDRDALAAEFGFVFDHASPIGDLIVSAPTHSQVEGRFRGQAAHAGIRPEEGRNAIAAAASAVAALEFGRLDDQTTANVGRIEGGSALNVVAESCDVEIEVRSLDHDRAGEVLSRLVDSLTAGTGGPDGRDDLS